MDEKKLKEVEELLTGAEQDIEARKVEEAKAYSCCWTQPRQS